MLTMKFQATCDAAPNEHGIICEKTCEVILKLEQQHNYSDITKSSFSIHSIPEGWYLNIENYAYREVIVYCPTCLARKIEDDTR